MNDALRATLLAAYESLGEALGQISVGQAAVETYLTDPLGQYGERRPGWLGKLNNDYMFANPTGYVGAVGPDFGPDPGSQSRQRLILIDAILDPRALLRSDLTTMQAANLQYFCNNLSAGVHMTSSRDEITNTSRLMPVWVPGPIPDGAPAFGIVALPGNHYSTELQIEAAVRRYYVRAGFGDLAKG